MTGTGQVVVVGSKQCAKVTALMDETRCDEVSFVGSEDGDTVGFKQAICGDDMAIVLLSASDAPF